MQEKMVPIDFETQVLELFTREAIAAGISLSRSSPRSYADLMHDIQINEAALLLDLQNNEIVRFNKVAALHITYLASTGQSFRLREAGRYTLNEDATFTDFLNDQTVATASQARPQPYSLTERMKMSGEQPVEAAVRAIMEELFGLSAKFQQGGEDDTKHKLWQILSRLSDETLIQHRGAWEKGNSYQGIRSLLEKHVFRVTLSHENKLPIQEDEQCLPQPLYEYIPDKGYITVFEWEKI